MLRSSSTSRWYLRVTESGTTRLIHGFIKQTPFCLSLSFRGHKTEAFKTSKLSISKSVFVPICTYSNESFVVTERMISQVQAAKMGFLRRVHSFEPGGYENSKGLIFEPRLRIERSHLRSTGESCNSSAGFSLMLKQMLLFV